MRHKHKLQVYKMDYESKGHKYGYAYYRCECGALAGAPIKSKEERSSLVEQEAKNASEHGYA